MDKQDLNIAKFGGTSVANFAAISNCAKIVADNNNTRVVVVSAAAGVTNYLVELAHSRLTSEQKHTLIAQITEIELAILQDLSSPQATAHELHLLLDSLQQLAFEPEILSRADLKDELLSHGERMSSLLFTEVLKQQGVVAENFDARSVLKTDDQFGQGLPLLEEISAACSALMAPKLVDSVLVTQGFIGSDADGRTTTLGRGGSDYTAALLAEALSCDHRHHYQ